MTTKRRTVTLIAFAGLLTFCASAAEFEVLATGITVGDMIGSPPAQTTAGQATIRNLERRGHFAVAGTAVALAIGSLLLGTALEPFFERTLPGLGGRVAGYFVALLTCPVVSLLPLLFMGLLMSRGLAGD